MTNKKNLNIVKEPAWIWIPLVIATAIVYFVFGTVYIATHLNALITFGIIIATSLVFGLYMYAVKIKLKKE